MDAESLIAALKKTEYPLTTKQARAAVRAICEVQQETRNGSFQSVSKQFNRGFSVARALRALEEKP